MNNSGSLSASLSRHRKQLKLTTICLCLFCFTLANCVYQTPLTTEAPCAKHRVRIFVIASNCFETYSEQRHARFKYDETIVPFITSLEARTLASEIYLIRFCNSVDDAILVKYRDIMPKVANQPKWITWSHHKKAYQAAMMEANMLAAKLAQTDKMPFKNVFVSVMQVDYKVWHSLKTKPYLEHTFKHYMFYMAKDIQLSEKEDLARQTGLSADFITLIDYRHTYKQTVNNKYACEGTSFNEKCESKFECVNNLVCDELKCSCPHQGMVASVDGQYCRQNIYEECNHNWNCQKTQACELQVCRARMPTIVCPVPCSSQTDCPKQMMCSKSKICAYVIEKQWENWIRNISVQTNKQLVEIYYLQYYWLLLSGGILLLTAISIPAIIWYRIKKNTIDPEEIKDRVTRLGSDVATRITKMARATRDTFNKATFPKFARFENWPSHDSEEESEKSS